MTQQLPEQSSRADDGGDHHPNSGLREGVPRRAIAAIGDNAIYCPILDAAEVSCTVLDTFKRRESDMGNTYLFIDWVHVDKGRMEVTLDANRLSKAGKEFVERYEREWDIYRDFSGHGMKRLRIPFGVQIAVEKAKKSAPWLEADRPWEGSISWLTVIEEDGKFRCWYLVKFPKEDAADAKRVMAGEQEMDFGGGALCYAESEDGLHWVKPSLGIFTFGGSKTNNIVSPYGGSSAVFRDDSGPADERYKAFHWDRLHDVP